VSAEPRIAAFGMVSRADYDEVVKQRDALAESVRRLESDLDSAEEHGRQTVYDEPERYGLEWWRRR